MSKKPEDVELKRGLDRKEADGVPYTEDRIREPEEAAAETHDSIEHLLAHERGEVTPHETVPSQQPTDVDVD
eukprot:scaffold4.g4900.t1